MEYDFYTLGVLYLVYSFAGWVGETVVATVRGKHFANRGAAAGPFCFVYGSTAVLLAVGFTDLRSDPVYLFFACTLASTVMEWLTAKLLERLHRRKWWDYSGKRFNLNGCCGCARSSRAGCCTRWCGRRSSWQRWTRSVRPCWWGAMRPNTRCWNS